MKRATSRHPFEILDILRDERISKKRSPVERCFSVIKIAFKVGHVKVADVERAAVKVMFSVIGYNLYNLYGLVSEEMK